MYILIVGAGKIGYFLAKRLCQGKHTVSIIDRDRVVCEEIAKELEALVINGAQRWWRRLPGTTRIT